MRDALLVPELRHAMLAALDCALGLTGRDESRVKRASFVRNGRVAEVRKIGRSFALVGRNDIL
jgi:hypothetical protein